MTTNLFIYWLFTHANALANLMAADFRGAVLQGAKELTATQLLRARTSNTTVLPSGARGPFIRGGGTEFPRRS